MYAYTDDGDTVDAYQRSVRDRANASLHELEEVLTASPNATLNTSGRAKEALSAAVHPRSLHWYEAESRPKKYKDAASVLKNLVKDDDPQGSQRLGLRVDYREVNEWMPASMPSAPRGPLPSTDETASLLHQQTFYIQQLEAENRYLKDEFASVRIKIRDLLEENRRLHEELKKSVMEEVMTDGELVNMAGEADKSLDTSAANISRLGLKHWQVELEKLSALHTAKTERLESQLGHTREEIQKYEQLVEDLRAQIRVHEAIPTRDEGVDIFMTEATRGYNNATIDRLTRERNELMEHVATLKMKLNEMTHREDDAYQQMKKGIELVEQAQLEQTQAMVQKEQLAEELNNMKHRFDAHIQNTQHKIQEERDLVRKENQAVVDEMNTKIKELTTQAVTATQEMERAVRDKVELTNQLDDAKLQLRHYDKEVSMATENFNAESTNAKLQKSHAQNESSRLRTELDNVRRERDQEKSRHLLEVDDFKRRLHKAERDLVNSKEECIHLTSNTQALEREMHIAKLARDSVERGRSEDLKTLSKRSQAREEELNAAIADLEEQHSHTTSEMDTMLSKQNKLIGKLKTECRRQAAQLELTLKKNRAESGRLRRHNEELRGRLTRTTGRLKDLEDQVEQHSRVQEKMKERLKMMDDHAQHQGTQVLELLTRQTSLQRDRTVLARELEFLRRNISNTNKDDMNKFVSSNKLLVDEVMGNIKTEENMKLDNYVTKPKDSLNIADLE